WYPVDWSPDERQLLMVRYVSINESYLHVLDLASSAMKPLNVTPSKKIGYRAPAFAHAGQKAEGVFYASDEDAEVTRLTYYDLTTGQKTLLFPELRWDVTQVAVSPDGKWLGFVANEGGTSVLYLARLQAGKVRPKELGRTAKKLELPKGVVWN